MPAPSPSPPLGCCGNANTPVYRPNTFCVEFVGALIAISDAIIDSIRLSRSQTLPAHAPRWGMGERTLTFIRNENVIKSWFTRWLKERCFFFLLLLLYISTHTYTHIAAFFRFFLFFLSLSFSSSSFSFDLFFRLIFASVNKIFLFISLETKEREKNNKCEPTISYCFQIWQQ